MEEAYNSWLEEMRSAYLYQVMAESENNILHKKLFSELQKAAQKQAQVWAEKIKKMPNVANKNQLLQYQPNFRTRLVAWLIRQIGTSTLHPLLANMKIRGMAVFRDYHSEHKHTSFNAASNLRAAVFGINDGLVSNMSLILGIAGASANHHFIVLAGIAGLLAGACSMGAGEYVSVRSQREIFEYQIDIERKELDEYPEEEMEELALIYEARGISQDNAKKLAKIFIENPETALNTLAREELGLNPEELVSPISAMLFSFFSFAAGALIPILPFLFGIRSGNLEIAMLLTGISLFMIGALMGFITNRNPFTNGLRMLLIGAIAGGLTFFIGHLLGVGTAG